MASDQLSPGWYWFEFPVADDHDWATYLRENRGVLAQRKTWQSRETAVSVFQVLSSHRWTFRNGRPTPAPKGMNTDLRDIANAPQPTPSLIVMIEEITGKAFDAFRRTGKAVAETAGTANGAVKVLLIGGAAVLLFNLFRATAPEDA